MRKSIVLLILFCCFTASLPAQRSSAGSAPPPVVAQSLIVRPGETVVVPLGIHGSRGEQLEFLIRSQPRFGKLSPVRAVGVNSAQVSYTAPLNGAEEDRFTYAVRNVDGVSAPGIVSIGIAIPATRPAKLVAPESLEMAKVFPGQRSTMELELRNTGGTALDGEASVPAPWSIEGEKRYRIGPGESVTLKLAFISGKAGNFHADVALGPEQRRNVTLHCEVEEALTVSAESLSLRAVAEGTARQAVFQIMNRSQEEREVSAGAGARLMVKKSFTVPARGKVDVAVAADAAVANAFEDTLLLESKGWSAKIAVHVAALQIAPEPPPKLPPAEPAPAVVKRPPAPVPAVVDVPDADAPVTDSPPAKEAGPALLRMQNRVAEFPNLAGKFAHVTSATSAFIEWPAEFAPKGGLHFQMRVMSLDASDDLKVTWQDLPSMEIKESAGKLRSEITGLAPAQIYTFRAVRGAEPVFTVQFSTPQKKPFINIEMRTVVLALLFSALAWLAWRKWKTRARSAW